MLNLTVAAQVNLISSHLGGKNTRQLATSGFREFLAMQIPRATFPQASEGLTKSEFVPSTAGDKVGRIVKEGARIS